MARISLDPPRGLLYRLLEWYSKRVYGTVLDPGRAMAHNPRVLWSYARFEQSVARWNKLDPDLKLLAEMAAASANQCGWCTDFGDWEARRRGLDAQKVHEVPYWRTSDVYTPLERDVMAYAEALSAGPAQVQDELSDRLREQLGEPALVELATTVAVENMRSRFNIAMGLTGQGFADSAPGATAGAARTQPSP